MRASFALFSPHPDPLPQGEGEFFGGWMIQGTRILEDAPERLRSLINERRFAFATNIAAMVLLVFSAFDWQQRMNVMDISSAPPEEADAQNIAAPAYDLQVLLDAMLFGRAESDGQPLQPPLLSSLNLVLNGVMATHTGGSALVAVKGQPQQAFGVGDEVLPGVVLSAVLQDRILLKRGGMLEGLLLEGAADALLFSVGVAPVQSALVQSPSRDSGATRFVLLRDTLRQVRSPQELLSQAVVVPSSGGGFVLQEIESGSLIEQFGLRAGDVVLIANGQALRSADDIMRAYQGSQGMNEVKLEISRDGRRVQHLYDIR
jgi:general secretion pathway protein C